LLATYTDHHTHTPQELSAVAAAAAAADDERFAAESAISKLQQQVQQLEQQLSDVQQIAAARATELLTVRAESSARHEEVSAAAEEVRERS
jgi:predicted  nucleic acid-binding Zn-ribbon protein